MTFSQVSGMCLQMNLISDPELRKFIKNETDRELFYSAKEHYTLLSTLSRQYNGVRIYDLGSYKGLSALALSSNQNNMVISYDIVYGVQIDRPENVEFRVGNFYNDFQLLNSPLIMLDVDPHDGLFERNFVDNLVRNNYKGTVICDDIHLNDGMKTFWDSVTQEKTDITEYGHWSGTGMITFK